MSSEDWVRARSGEKVELRIQGILDAAARVFQQVSYEKVTMLMIAREARSSRSNLYRYFKSREEIFLTLFLQDIKNWAGDLKSRLTREVSLEVFVDQWVETLMSQKRLLALSPLLALSLERNSSEEVLRKTKLILHSLMAESVSVIRRALPHLAAREVYDFFVTHQALLAGGQPMGQHSEMEMKVIRELPFSHDIIDFPVLYRKGIFMYLKGVLSG